MIALIAAVSKNGVIGKAGRIPWHLPGEQKRFRDLTLSETVIMGKRTFLEIGRPLPGRTTIVLSKDPAFSPVGCLKATSLREALSLSTTEHTFIAGGAGLYAEALPLCERLYLTEVLADIEGDTFFPAFDPTRYEKQTEDTVPGEIAYRYVTYTLRKTEGTPL